MSLLKLRLSMIGTLAIIIAISTLFFSFILTAIGRLNLFAVAILVTIFNIAQWLLAPYIINSIYRVRELSEEESPRIHGMFSKLLGASKIKKPKLMIAEIPLPNAFAYGSPLTGNYVAVTRGLLDTLEEEEVEAVIGHELGHLKHKDVQLMMFLSLLPAIFYWIGWSLFWSRAYARGERGGGAMAIGMLCILAYYILTFLILHLSRTREYYADRHSVSIVKDGARKLSEGLAKIVNWTGRVQCSSPESIRQISHFKTLFIADPERAESDVYALMQKRIVTRDEELVRHVLERKLTFWDRIAEFFSTHPNIVKRLRALQELT